jgi:hypothetical protein
LLLRHSNRLCVCFRCVHRLTFSFFSAPSDDFAAADIRQTKSAVVTLSAQHPEPIHSLHFATDPGGDSSWLISGSMGGIYGWNTNNMFESHQLEFSQFFPPESQFKCVGLDYNDSGSALLSSFRTSDPAQPDIILVRYFLGR